MYNHRASYVPNVTLYVKELMYNHRASYVPNVYIICKGTHVQPPGFVWPQCVHYM